MKHLVIIGAVWPEPLSTAAGSRMLQIIALFQKQNFKVFFLSAAQKSAFSSNLADLHIETHQIELNSSTFDTIIKELNPEIVLYDRFMMEEQFGWRVTENCPNACTILDTEDLHFLRKAREKAFKQNRELQFEDYFSTDFKREMAAILRCDLSLIISEYEMNLLQKVFQINPAILFYLPFLTNSVLESDVSFGRRSHFVSIGNFLHEPNWQTVLALKKCWNAIKKQLPEAELHVYGAYIPEKAKQLHDKKSGFLIKGRAEDVKNVFENARILLAPIPFGAGLKGKLFDAMQYGLPSITTTIGAEGMHQNLDWNGFITQNEAEFIEKAVVLYKDEQSWNDSQKNGYAILNKVFQEKQFDVAFEGKINEIVLHLKNHRMQHYLGQILQHQTLQSTKYMSKWIEEKNKKQ